MKIAAARRMVSGMGLQIIQDRGDALEGSLEVRGEAGRTVAITIPAHARDPAGARG